MTVNHTGGWPPDLRLLDAFDAAAFAVDAGGQVVHANETAERLFGRPGGVLVGETLMTHLFSENEQEALAVVIRQVLDGRPWRGRLDIRHTDGSVHQAELSCSPLWRDQEVVGHQLPPTVIKWSEVAPGAFRVLKPGGRFIVLDFERIPGVSPPSRLDHVRAGKETVIEEVTASGFRLREEVKTLGLKDNYFLVFERL